MLKLLEIPFRFVILSSQETGRVPTKTIDFEESNKEEDEILLKIRHVLMDILNKILLFARKTTLLEFDEQRIVKPIDAPEIGSGKIGVMLVHGILGGPQGFAEFESYLQSKGFITYNVRLPGHVQTIDEFLSTPIAEMESFLISSFKYFWNIFYFISCLGFYFNFIMIRLLNCPARI